MSFEPEIARYSDIPVKLSFTYIQITFLRFGRAWIKLQIVQAQPQISSALVKVFNEGKTLHCETFFLT